MPLRRALMKALALAGLSGAVKAAFTREALSPAERMLRAVEADFRDTAAHTGIAAPSAALRRALLRVPRERFVPPEVAHLAYENRPLAIGEGQTISQPFIVALMTELL
ncbi:MAG: protein-L-isoaspartate O-methyltransferase, partial [Burkholderiaceae bacterium]